MKRSLHISIPEPCHENWDKMNPVEQGRFCLSCQKSVVDFSQMTDKEVLNYFFQHDQKLCGRFADDQLNRVIADPKERKSTKWYYALNMFIVGFLFNAKANSQDKTILKGDTIVNAAPALLPEDSKELVARVGGISAVSVTRGKIVSGIITDTAGEPIPFATISVLGTKTGTSADANGNFFLKISNREKVTLKVSAVGMESVERTVGRNEDFVSICLRQSEVKLLGDVVVGGVSFTRRRKTTGLSLVSVRIKESVITDTLKSIFSPSFKIYPNPVKAGAVINLQLNVKEPGAYDLAMVNSNGQLLLQRSLNIIFKRYNEALTMPSSIPAGTYIIKLTCEKTRKSYTTKLLVQ